MFRVLKKDIQLGTDCFLIKTRCRELRQRRNDLKRHWRIALEKVTITDLLDAGVHLGHPTRRWNPKMKPYIHGARNGIYIFDLAQTMQGLHGACRVLYDIAASGGKVLFVGTKRQAQEVMRDAAQDTGMYYMCERWLGGTLTNNTTIRKSINKMLDIQKIMDSGEIDSMPKKEASSLRRVYGKLHRNLAGVVNMKKMPDVMVVIDIEREDIALNEARTLGIPVVALVDTNCNPDLVDFVIPGNDDALRSIKVIVDTLTGSIKKAMQVFEKQQAEEAAAREAEAKRKAEEAEARKAEAAKVAAAKKAELAAKKKERDAKGAAAAEAKKASKPQAKKPTLSGKEKVVASPAASSDAKTEPKKAAKTADKAEKPAKATASAKKQEEESAKAPKAEG